MKKYIEKSIKSYITNNIGIDLKTMSSDLADYITKDLDENYIIVAYPIGKGSDNFENKN